MDNMRRHFTKKSAGLLIILALFLLLFFRFALALSFPDIGWKIGKDDKIKMGVGSPIIQKFEAGKNNLSRIDILFGKSNTISGKFSLEIYDENCSRLLRKKTVYFQTPNSDNTYDFAFSKIKDSKDKTYCLKLFFTPKNKKMKTPYVFIIGNSRPENKFLFDSGEKQEYPGKSLSFRPAYKNDCWWQDFKELDRRISQYKPWFLKQHYLAAIFILAIILSVGLVVVITLA